MARVDELIARGDGLWVPISGHKSKIALFLGLTPRAAGAIRSEVGDDATVLIGAIDRTMPTWYLSWGERPVHYGENFIDNPDNVQGIFAAHALLGPDESRKTASADLDLPWCPGDLYFIEKVALCLDRL